VQHKPRRTLRNRWKGILPAIAVLLAPAGTRGEDAEPAHKYISPWRTPWSYDGARGSSHWSELDPQYAACKGKEQSPIDIRNAEQAALSPLRFEDRRGPLNYVINNGYTIRVNYPSGNGNWLIAGGERYLLTQLHFHRPSEEYVHGKPHAMVAHLMYQADDGKVAGVAVFLSAGGANATIQQIWDHMPSAEGEEEVVGVEVNPAGLLPHDTAYYTYMGSLSAPPCTEGVMWFVLKRAVAISARQISAFAKLYPHDVRPPQPLNGRIVKESE
jgi:carbonic anhydrase